jgi:hypothetical protein
MRIVNETTYRAWNPRHNGVKRQSEGVLEGFFGAINLLGARLTSQRPTAKFWNTQYSLVQLRYEFYTETSTGSYETARAAGNGMTGLTPQDVGRTFFTFWDIDQGQPTFSGSFDQIEAFQMGPQALRVRAAVRRAPSATGVVASGRNIRRTARHEHEPRLRRRLRTARSCAVALVHTAL